MKKKTLLLAAAACCAPLIIFLYGPTVIHNAYARSTSSATIEKMGHRYNALEAGDWSLPAAEREQSGSRRMAIWYWLHVRGFTIDEGMDEGIAEGPFLIAVYALHASKWEEICTYWRSSQESRDPAFLLADLK